MPRNVIVLVKDILNFIIFEYRLRQHARNTFSDTDPTFQPNFVRFPIATRHTSL